MRIVAVTWGSEGDCRPLVALCRGLASAGHDVVLLAERSASTYANLSGVRFVPLAGDMVAEFRAAAAQRGGRKDYATATTKLLVDMVRRNASAWMHAVLEEAKGADAIVTAGLAVWAGLSCAEALRIPAIVASLQPARPTREFASPFLQPRRLPGWANRLTHEAVLAVMRQSLRKSINEARREVTRQSPRYPEWQGYPMLFGISPTLVLQPQDWPERFAIVGYWWPPPDDAWQPDASLAAFLGEGEPPVYVGFGSMVAPDRTRFQSLVLEALGSRRALLSRGWGGWEAQSLPANVRVIGPTPHERLFPLVATAVHHGGAGTSHAAAHAGVPSVVLPFAGDQFFWADRLHRAGVAPAGLPQRRVTANALADALRLADDAAMRARAKVVAQSMAREDGVREAVARIERLAAATSPPT